MLIKKTSYSVCCKKASSSFMPDPSPPPQRRKSYLKHVIDMNSVLKLSCFYHIELNVFDECRKKEDDVFGSILIYPKIWHCIFTLNFFICIFLVRSLCLLFRLHVRCSNTFISDKYHEPWREKKWNHVFSIWDANFCC